MGLFSASKKVAGHVVNVKVTDWLGWNNLKASFNGIVNIAKGLVTPEQSSRVENFEEAISRLNLTAEDLQARKKEFTRLAIFYLVISLAIFSYSLYIALHSDYHNIRGFFMGLSITIFSLSYAFRYHFWIHQINEKKLGCSLKDWLNKNDS